MAETLYWLYVATLVGATAAALGACAFLVRGLDDGDGPTGWRWLLAFLLALAVWSGAYALQLLSPAVGTKLVWARLVATGTAGAGVAWFLFVVRYTGRASWLTGWRLGAVLTPAVLVVPVAWTNHLHGLVWADEGTVTAAGTTFLATAKGPAFVASAAYLYFLMAASLALLGHLYVTNRSLQRGQAATLLVAGLVPVLGNAAYWLWGRAFLPVDVTPVLLTVTAVLVVVALAWYRLLDVLPVAQHSLLEELEDAVAVVDDRGRLLYLNGAGRRLFDDARIGDPLTTLFSDGGRADDAVGTEVLLHRDGERQYYDLRQTELSDGRGSARGELLVFRDVTDRKEREQSLAEYKTIFETVTDAVYVLDPEGTVRMVNEPLAEMLGKSPAEMVGSHATSFITGRAYERGNEVIAELFESEKHHGTIELVLEDEAGRKIPCETDISLLPFDEQYRGCVGVIRDVSERLQREQQVAVLNRVLRHNLRNDMNVIVGQLDVLAAEADAADLDGDVEMAREHARDLLDLAENARTAERVLGRSATTVTCPLREVLEPAVAGLRDTYPRADVDLRDLPSVEVVARETIDVAIDSLLENAVEHNDRDAPEVVVSADVRSDAVAVRIADDGPGIPEDELDVLTAGTETPLEHGSGLGLWLAHWVVSRSGGTLSVDEREERGTVVTVTLQRANGTNGGGGATRGD